MNVLNKQSDKSKVVIDVESQRPRRMGNKMREGKRNKRSRCKKWNDNRRREIRLKQISVLNKQSEETPEPFHQHFRVSVEAERDKDNHGRASGIFSGSMASGSYLLSDGATNRLKLPLSLCQEENAQLYFPRWGDGAEILCGRQLFSTDTRWTMEPVKLLFSLLFYCSRVFYTVVTLWIHQRTVESKVMRLLDPFVLSWLFFCCG